MFMASNAADGKLYNACSTNQDDASTVASWVAGMPATSFSGFHLYDRLRISEQSTEIRYKLRCNLELKCAIETAL